MAAGLHLHDPESDGYNTAAVEAALPTTAGLILMEWAWRRQGLILPAGNPAGITGLADLAGKRRAAVMPRQEGAGAQRLFLELLAAEGIAPGDLRFTPGDRARRKRPGAGRAGRPCRGRIRGGSGGPASRSRLPALGARALRPADPPPRLFRATLPGSPGLSPEAMPLPPAPPRWAATTWPISAGCTSTAREAGPGRHFLFRGLVAHAIKTPCLRPPSSP